MGSLLWALTLQYLLPWAQDLRLPGSGSAAVVHRLSCSTVCGIFSDQGWNPCLLHGQADSLPLSHHGSPQLLLDICRVQSAVLRVARELTEQHFGLGEALNPQKERRRRMKMKCLAILGERMKRTFSASSGNESRLGSFLGMMGFGLHLQT